MPQWNRPMIRLAEIETEFAPAFCLVKSTQPDISEKNGNWLPCGMEQKDYDTR